MDRRSYFAISALMIITALVALHGHAFAKGSVVNSPHNLSVTGGRGKHAVGYDEIRICVFCHTPHNAVNVGSLAPLWNRALPPEAGYTMYQSDTFDTVVSVKSPVPTGSSRVCLSCHDGTLALAAYGGPVLKGGGFAGSSPVTMPTDTDPTRNPNLTTDLSDDHPISFAYTNDLASRAQLAPPATLPSEIKLDKDGNVQCTACHDPHNNEYGNFLVMSNNQTQAGVTSPLCVTCHTPSGWDNTSPHYAGAGCLNCHSTHTAGVKQYLLKAPLDQVCFNGTGCHNGTLPPGSPTPHAGAMAEGRSLLMVLKEMVQGNETQVSQPSASTTPAAPNNMKAVFSQSVYRHPIGAAGASRFRANEQLPLRTPRVECVDCHNAHVAGSITAPGLIKRSLKKVKGISKDTLGVVESTSEYQICYKCHSGAFAYRFVGISKPNRVITETDQRKRFDAANPSFHPVAANRRGNGQSLLAQYQNSMITIACSDCHNSDQSKKAGGTGPNGPHGSRFEHILLARYEMPLKGGAARGTNCSAYRSDYALCFTCHSEDYVMIGGSGFSKGLINEHALHVVGRCIPCFACHDPHGVPLQDGANAVNNSHLINFDRGYAASAAIPIPRYDAMAKSCTVSCHSGGTHSYAQ